MKLADAERVERQPSGEDGAESSSRIRDARAFNATPYRLSYLGVVGGDP